MKAILRNIALLGLMSLLLISCDSTVHEYPKPCEVTLVVEMAADLSEPEYYCDVECDVRTGSNVVVRHRSNIDTRFNEDVLLRFTCDLYRVDGAISTFVERRLCFATTDTPTPQAVTAFNVVPDQYKVLVWCDYVRAADKESWYYNNDDLRAIVYSDITPVDNNDKDVYSGMLAVDLMKYEYEDGYYTERVIVDMSRPLGRFKVISFDREDFLKAGGVVEDISAKITYKQYVSAGYNVETQGPNKFDPTRAFTSEASLTDDGEILLAYDYIFVNGKESNVLADFYFYNADGVEISHWLNIKIPLKRNHETIVRGAFLTTSFGTGGIGIDDSFDGREIIIEIP